MLYFGATFVLFHLTFKKYYTRRLFSVTDCQTGMTPI